MSMDISTGGVRFTRAGAARRIQSAFRQRIKTGRYSKTFKKRAVKFRSASQIKRVIRSNTETKIVDYAYGNQALFHNGGVPIGSGMMKLHLNPENVAGVWPAQGDGEENRNGNDIYAIGWTLRMLFRLPLDRLNTKIRCFVIKAVKGSNPVGGYTGMFDGVTNNVLLDPIDKDRVKVMKTFMIGGGRDLNPGVSTSGKEKTFMKQVFVPLKKVIRFFDNGTLNNDLLYDYYFVAAAYDTLGSLVSDNIANCQVWQRLSYKDQ